MVASNDRGMAVVVQALAIALWRGRGRLVGLCGAALGTEGGGQRGVIADGEGRRCGGMRYPEDGGEAWKGGG
jgi:hypothetical protein